MPRHSPTPAEKIKAQHRAAARRAKYGPAGKPAPVTVRNLDTGEIIETRPGRPATRRQIDYVRDMRKRLGLSAAAPPADHDEAVAQIRKLQPRVRAQRRASRRPPS